MKSIQVRSTQWHYQEQGIGDAIVFVHGFPLDHRIWNAQLAGLSNEFRVIAVDLKGFGQSKSTAAFTIDSMADELAEFISDVVGSPCVLAGLSMGGYVAFSLAARHPEAIKRLAIVCSKAEADTQAGKEARQKMAETAMKEGSKPVAAQMLPKMFSPDTYQNRPELVEELKQIMEACPPTTIANACFAMRDRADRIPDLPGLKMPVMIILGEKDAIIPSATGATIAVACKQGVFKLIPNAGHLAPMEEPAAFNLVMAEFAKL